MESIAIFNYRRSKNITRAKAGDKEALLSLINENRLNIYRVAKGILKNEEDIKDAIQNTIIKSFQNIRTLKKDNFFRTWIIRILINECNDILRKNKKYVSLYENNSEKKYNDSYENIDLTTAINSLNEDLRITTVLFYFEDMPTKEIAKILEIPEGTVRSRLNRARNKLKEIMDEV